jgi:tetratricopeptide (TPR) repeat protein
MWRSIVTNQIIAIARLVLFSVLFAAPAFAAGTDEQVAALIQQGDQLYEQSKQAYASKNYNAGNKALADAVKAYNKAIELDPKSYLAHQKLGDLYFGDGSPQRNCESAIVAYLNALKLQPESAYVYSQLSRCYLNLDRFTQAIAAAEVSIQLNPGEAAGYYNLGFIHADMGNNEEARTFQARLLPMNASLAQQLGVKIGWSSRLTSNIERPKAFGNPKIALVAVKPGSFMLGADDKKEGRHATIRKGFSIGKYPVTQAQWQMVMGDNPSFTKVRRRLPGRERRRTTRSSSYRGSTR